MFIVVAWMDGYLPRACTWLLNGIESDVKEAEEWVSSHYPNSGRTYIDVESLDAARELVKKQQ